MTKEQLHKANEIDKLIEDNFRYKKFADKFKGLDKTADKFKGLDKTSNITMLIQMGVNWDYKIVIDDVELMAVCFKSMYDYCNAKEEELKTKFENL